MTCAQKKKPQKGKGIALVTRAMKKIPQVPRESFWTTAARDGFTETCARHPFPQVPHGPLLCSWTTDA